MSRETLQLPASTGLHAFHGMYSRAPEMQTFFTKLARVARTDCTVHLCGESGTGKELAACALHAASARARAPYHAINCATLSPTLLESELFGHLRGAFTGAIRNHPGLFAAADRGSVLLDEVTEIPLDLQGRLLRVLQEKTFVPVGGTGAVKVDVRVVSATNRSLPREIAEGRFRQDLGYRLRVVPLAIPPLRERSGDASALFWHFVAEMNERGPRRVTGVSRHVLRAVERYPWPGNVRELRSAVEHAFAIGEGPVLELDDMPGELTGASPLLAMPVDAATPSRNGERERILAALARFGGRKGAAAKALGMSRQTLWRKLYVHGLAG